MSFRRSRLKSSLPTTATLAPLRQRDEKSRREDGPETDEPAGEASAPGRQRETAQRITTSKRRLQRRVTPLDVLQQPIQAGMRKVFDLRRFLIVIGLTAGTLLLPLPPDLSRRTPGVGALRFTGSILAWSRRPLPIAALMVPICQIALGIDVVTGAFGPFGSPVLFLILGSLFLAEALRKHGWRDAWRLLRLCSAAAT